MDLINRLLGNTSLVLPGKYATLNFHWETWSLPNWYHSSEAVNWTTVDMVNELAREKKKVGVQGRRGTDMLSAAEPAPPARPPSSALDTATLAQSDPLSPAPHLPPSDPLSSSPDQPSILPRFPPNHPLSKALDSLYREAAIIHFTAVGKPWQFTPEVLRGMRPDAHQLLGEMAGVWRREAGSVCPGWGEGS